VAASSSYLQHPMGASNNHSTQTYHSVTVWANDVKPLRLAPPLLRSPSHADLTTGGNPMECRHVWICSLRRAGAEQIPVVAQGTVPSAQISSTPRSSVLSPFCFASSTSSWAHICFTKSGSIQQIFAHRVEFSLYSSHYISNLLSWEAYSSVSWAADSG